MILSWAKISRVAQRFVTEKRGVFAFIMGLYGIDALR
jgi:hypothetical protein